MTQFSISAVWYPLWGFAALMALLLLPSILPANVFFRYILKNSAPHWIMRMGLPSLAKTSMNNSTSSSDSLYLQTTNDLSRRGPSYRPDREVGADFPSNLQQRAPVRAINPVPVELPSLGYTTSQQDQEQNEKEERLVSGDLEAQS